MLNYIFGPKTWPLECVPETWTRFLKWFVWVAVWVAPSFICSNLAKLPVPYYLGNLHKKGTHAIFCVVKRDLFTSQMGRKLSWSCRCCFRIKSLFTKGSRLDCAIQLPSPSASSRPRWSKQNNCDIGISHHVSVAKGSCSCAVPTRNQQVQRGGYERPPDCSTAGVCRLQWLLGASTAVRTACASEVPINGLGWWLTRCSLPCLESDTLSTRHPDQHKLLTETLSLGAKRTRTIPVFLSGLSGKEATNPLPLHKKRKLPRMTWLGQNKPGGETWPILLSVCPNKPRPSIQESAWSAWSDVSTGGMSMCGLWPSIDRRFAGLCVAVCVACFRVVESCSNRSARNCSWSGRLLLVHTRESSTTAFRQEIMPQ